MPEPDPNLRRPDLVDNGDGTMRPANGDAADYLAAREEPPPETADQVEVAAKLKRQNLRDAKRRGWETAYWRRSLRGTERKLRRLRSDARRARRRDRALGERRPAPRRRGGARTASRAGPSDSDSDPPGDVTPPAGRETAGVAR